MTYEQFWEQDCELVKYYRKAEIIRAESRNHAAWLQGAYIYEALLDASPVFRSFAKKGTKPTPYRDTPYELLGTEKQGQKRVQERRDDKAKAFMEAFMVKTNQKFQQKGGGVSV